MIRFFENYDLQPHNTFGVDVKAKYFFEFTESEDLDVFLQSNQTWEKEKILLLGEGSNILFRSDFDGLIIHPNIPGSQIVNEDRQNVWLEVGSGENWDEFVRYCVDCEFGGVENLAFIPGTVGAAPVQNIGAYGQEVHNVIEKVKGYDLNKRQLVEYSNEECQFSYRNSIFKSRLKNQFVILSVVFRLDKFPEFELGYKKLEEKVNEHGEVNLQNIKQAVIDIRSEKLPDVNVIGSAGSFFKNPIVDIEAAKKIEGVFKEMPAFPASEGKVKLAAGWLIDKAGWKGYREGDLGVHEKQALVIVNYGNATGTDIYNLSEKIKQSVFEKFGVELEREVNCV
ncbi:MAG: UDP-N-acetylmuramate dehydrogenase [Bacteroidetes bacterium]|nr:UDP-N-acetylmuramate dehydrogenase [Bacteroidota bacterium]